MRFSREPHDDAFQPRELFRDTGSHERRRSLARKILMMEADECAGAFLFLASEQLSGYMTGQILEVNGGQYMP